MKEVDFAELAEYMAAVILEEKNVSQPVSSFRQRFTRMQYCLPEEQAEPLVDDLINHLIKS
ncbi:hypothetical protein ES703_25419 [subsurface metagenome]